MDCTGCGACCTDLTVPLTRMEQLVTAWDETDGEGNLRKVNGRCIRLDPVTRTCTQYADRPQVCRDFPPGCGRCVLLRIYARVRLGGIGTGPLPEHIRPGSLDELTETLEWAPKTNDSSLTSISHPNPDYPTQLALEAAKAELPSNGF